MHFHIVLQLDLRDFELLKGRLCFIACHVSSIYHSALQYRGSLKE